MSRGSSLDGHVSPVPGGPIRVTDGEQFALGMVETLTGLACDATNRGAGVRVRGAAGAIDTEARCRKTAADTYAWVTIPSTTDTALLYQPLDSDLTTIAGIADPNADRILFWDDSAGAYAHLTASTGLTITTTNITAGVPGLVLIGDPISFAGVSSVPVDGVFTSEFQNYRIEVNIDSETAASNIHMRMRAAGSDTSTANYDYFVGFGFSNAATLGGSNGAATQSWLIGGGFNGACVDGISIDFFDPQAARRTRMGFQSGFYTSTTLFQYLVGEGGIRLTTQYDGFTILPVSGTIAGTIFVYGKRMAQ